MGQPLVPSLQAGNGLKTRLQAGSEDEIKSLMCNNYLLATF
jgi:hypothetical protein